MTAIVVVTLAVLAVNVLLVLALLIRYIREGRADEDEHRPLAPSGVA